MKTTWNQKLGKKQEITIVCENCHKEFIIISRPKLKSKRKFCSRSCATSFANKQRQGQKRSAQSIIKQKDSAKKFWQSENGYLLKKQRSEIAKKQSSTSEAKKQFQERICSVNKNIEKRKQTIKEKVARGEWNTWKTRNIRSYPELYVENILLNNNLKFEIEKPITKKELSIGQYGSYFLDFYFENKKINLEIDGSQHQQPERKKSDKIRDNALQKLGIKVVRIKWRNLKNKKERNKFIKEINNFIKLVQ